MPNLDLTGAQVLLPDGLSDAPVSIAQGRIVDAPTGRAVDLNGFLVLPGIVDLHGDGFERHLAQRRGAMKQMDQGLVACEAELAANGITTAVLAQFVSWEGGMRGLDFADRVFAAIRDVNSTLVTDLHAQLRFETHLLDLFDELPNRIADWGVGYVVFNDHLPHDRLEAGKLPRRLNGQALKAGRSPEKHHNYMLELHSRRADVPAALDDLCARLTRQGIRMGSHDDATAEGRARWRGRGAHVAEFPETIEAAEAAHNAGDAVLMGSPNVVRGGSHNGNLSAIDLIAMGYCDALASDYHYPSPRRAALMLADAGVCDLAQAWHLVSAGPAAVLGLHDRGVLTPGKRADIVVLDAETRRVAATFVEGRVSYMSGPIAERFVR
ncbi:alpha-D-ribose 1-methylphosphonate 5-triphosphate diphosphatase [Sulfitobacter sp. JBTF-M27]|uniref:Alpha-D-ribose 1-methylphosphonate 5-triphosphate diphosphatase n=1 Tax=Sulfitobacter sediminilitoris TaxID=2698830 RepID=A0A6P0C8J9_9RHOB|nr:alpha-D-ribose 1-methylphosphonate 5-triphosphate diphosphatase [Sulfitobacter sediminilitoris]NEK22492.1 alpha-D-ribose 1-methylphosphonate 5-triphosphate diphosphatase [Sulfitobacter sediminilitoris]